MDELRSPSRLFGSTRPTAIGVGSDLSLTYSCGQASGAVLLGGFLKIFSLDAAVLIGKSSLAALRFSCRETALRIRSAEINVPFGHRAPADANAFAI